MANLQEVKAAINTTFTRAQTSLTDNTSHAYNQLQVEVRRLEGLTREAFQAKLKAAYQPLVVKLQKGQALSKSDQELLKLLIVGEAKYYTEHENDLENWKTEIERLMVEIHTIENDSLDDIDNLLHLRALCRDAMGILPELIFYHQEGERIERFEQATAGGITKEQGLMLANIIREMMSSDKM